MNRKAAIMTALVTAANELDEETRYEDASTLTRIAEILSDLLPDETGIDHFVDALRGAGAEVKSPAENADPDFPPQDATEESFDQAPQESFDPSLLWDEEEELPAGEPLV